MISTAIDPGPLLRAQIEWQNMGRNPFRIVFGTGPEFLWVATPKPYDREKLVKELVVPVIEAIQKDASENLDPFTDDRNEWIFYECPYTYLRNMPPQDDDEDPIELCLSEFQIEGPFTIWGWWQNHSDDVGGHFGTTRNGDLVVLFC